MMLSILPCAREFRGWPTEMEEKFEAVRKFLTRLFRPERKRYSRLSRVLGCGAEGFAVLPAQPRIWCALDLTLLSMPDSVDPSSFRSPDEQRPAVPLPIDREPRVHDPYAAFRFGDFALFTAGNLLSITGRL